MKRMTSSQKTGLMVLLAVFVAILGWRWRVASLEAEREMPVIEQVEAEEPLDVRQESKKLAVGAAKKEASFLHLELNAATAADLKQVKGIGEVLAPRIVKYRNVIGGYSTVDQLKKVYGLKAELFEMIAPQVYVDTNSVAYRQFRMGPPPPPSMDEFFVAPPPPEEEELEDRIKEDKEEKAVALVNLNTANKEELLAVKGIGPGTANGIVKYRNLIFFYKSIDQLSEVYGMRPENLEKIRSQVKIEPSFASFPHIKVNDWDKKQLASHIYLDYKMASLIIAYRDQHGEYKSLADLQEIRGIKTDAWERLEPYMEY